MSNSDFSYAMVRIIVLFFVCAFAVSCGSGDDTSSTTPGSSPVGVQETEDIGVIEIEGSLSVGTKISLGSEYLCEYPGVIDDGDRVMTYSFGSLQSGYVEAADGTILNGGDFVLDFNGKTNQGYYAIFNDSIAVFADQFHSEAQYSKKHHQFNNVLVGMTYTLSIRNVFGDYEDVDADCVLREHQNGSSSPVQELRCLESGEFITSDTYLTLYSDRSVDARTVSEGSSFGKLTYRNKGTYFYDIESEMISLVIRETADRCCDEHFETAVLSSRVRQESDRDYYDIISTNNIDDMGGIVEGDACFTY